MTGYFKPFRESHAIVEVVLFFEFAGRISFASDIKERILSAVASVEGRDWMYEPVKSIEVNVTGTSSPGVLQSEDGFQMMTFRGEPQELAWQIGARRNQVSLHCLEYSRWELTSKTIRSYLAAIFDALGEQSASVRMFGMKVLDRFMYFGDLPDFDASSLFDQDSEYLNSRMFESGHRWHLHTGWFEPGTGVDEEVLSQLSIDSSSIAPPDHRPNVGVSIDHTMTVRAGHQSELGDVYSVWTGDLGGVFERFEFMHTRNKEIVCSVLNRGVCDSMNMHVG